MGQEEGIAEHVVTPHAAQMAGRRAIPEEVIRAVLTRPEQRLEVREGRVVLQSRVPMGEREFLVRVFVDVERNPPEVVTAYRTSKVAKYWREGA